MEIKVDEISKLIRQQIEGFEKKTDSAEVGTVISVGDGISRIYGLEKVMAGGKRLPAGTRTLQQIAEHARREIATQRPQRVDLGPGLAEEINLINELHT